MGQKIFLDLWIRSTVVDIHNSRHIQIITTGSFLLQEIWETSLRTGIHIPHPRISKWGQKNFGTSGLDPGSPAHRHYGRYLQLPIYSDNRCGLVVTSGSLGNVSKDRYAYPKYRDSHSSTRENVEIFWEFFKMSTALCIPRRSPIQVLTQLNLA